MRVPRALDWWREVPGGGAWLDALPGIVGECAERWQLEIGLPLEGGNVSLALDVVRDGEPAVLKINYPDEESEHEPDALMHWNGRGAVRLLEYEASRRALLLERCEPGTRLWDVEDDADATLIASSVLARLRAAPPPAGHPFRSLAGEAARWSIELPRDWEAMGRPFEREILDDAVSACIELGRDQGDQVLLHQDFHGGNVLRSTREQWLAIDPKPLVGEREFDAASLLRDRRWLLDDGAAARLRRRLDIVTSELGLDRERTRRWGIAHALAWGVSGHKVEPDMIECARLLRATRP